MLCLGFEPGTAGWRMVGAFWTTKLWRYEKFGTVGRVLKAQSYELNLPRKIMVSCLENSDWTIRTFKSKPWSNGHWKRLVYERW